MNDFVRDQVRRDGVVPFWGELMAGGCVSTFFVSFHRSFCWTVPRAVFLIRVTETRL